MGKRYERHSDLCGCERCAREWDTNNPQPVWDVIDDPDYDDTEDDYYSYDEPPDDDPDFEDVEE